MTRSTEESGLQQEVNPLAILSSSEFLFLKGDPVLLLLFSVFPGPPHCPLKQDRDRVLSASLVFLLWPRLKF